MKKKSTLGWGGMVLLAIMASFWVPQKGHAQLLVDDFDRTNSSSVGNGWTESETIVPSSISISNNMLVLESNVAGREYISRTTPGTYEAVLTNNPCLLEWSFIMRQNALNPNGMTANNHGIAMVLAGSSGDLLQGQGYAVVMGSPGSTANPLRLVRYSNGLSSETVLTNLISVGNFSTQALAVRVTYDPNSDQWQMFYGSTPVTFADPLTASINAGTVTDAFYTSTSLPYIGCLWNHGVVNTTRSWFDNIRVPFDCSSRIEFSTSSGSVSSLAGSVQLPLELVNPHFANGADVTVELIGGDPAIVGGITSTLVPMPAGATSAQVYVNIPLNGECTGDQQLTFQITGITGGSGTAYVGPVNTFTLTVQNDLTEDRQVLHESFETDGAGTRYAISAAHASPGAGSYFLRADAATLLGASGLSIASMDGSACMGASALSSIAANAEASVTFNDLDILGMSAVNLSLLAGARYAANFDQAIAQRDHLTIEVNIDGTGWFTAGAFRSHKQNPYVDGWLAQDNDLDGVGEGIKLSNTLRSFNFPVNVQGTSMDVRIRFRTTAAGEDIFFDDIAVTGTLCQPIYFSVGSGSEDSNIWSHTRTGPPVPMTLTKNVSLVVQNGHSITATGSTEHLKDLTVEAGGSLHLQGADWSMHGQRLVNDGTIGASTGIIRMISDQASSITGTGNFDLYNLRLLTPAGTTVSSNIDIRGTLAIEEGILDASAANIRLISNASGTGRLGRVGVGADYIGEITTQRYIPAGNTNWRFLGSPVSGATVQHWQDDFFTAGYPGSAYPNFYSPPGSGIYWPSVRWYNESVAGALENDGLTGVTSSMPLATGQGFAAWCGTTFTTTSAFTIDLKGAPHIAHTPIVLPMSFTNTGNPVADGYNLVSNPLPSPISFAEVVRGADVANSYWIYDPISGNNATWNGIVGTNGANGIIQSSQAFWLKANGPSVTTTIGENAKVNNSTGGVFGNEMNDMAMMRLKVIDAQALYADETLIVFGMGTPGMDELDVTKMAFGHASAPSISSKLDQGEALSINMFGMPGTAVEIPIDVTVPVTGVYTIKASNIEALTGLTCVKLKDNLTGEEYQLIEGSEFSFTIEAGANDDARFVVKMATPIQRHIDHVTCNGLSDGAITITILDGEADLTLMDVFSGVLDQASGSIVTFDSLAAGEYMISLDNYQGCGELIGNYQVQEPMPIEAEITSNNAACGATNGTLVPQIFGGTAPFSFNWDTGSNEEVLQAGAGEYALTVTDANGCAITTDPQTIVADQGPIAAFSPAQAEIHVGEAVSFVNNSTNADEYEWDMGDGNIIQAPEVTYTFGLAGPRNISLKAINGACFHITTQQIMVIGTIGMAEFTNGEIQVWDDGSNINVRHTIAKGDLLRIELLDATGRLHSTTNAVAAPGTMLIPSAQLSAGVWFVRVTNGAEQFTSRIVIAR